MSRLLSDDLKKVLPRLREQEHSKDPNVFAVFFFPLSGWKWFVTEGESNGDDYIFFGYVVGLEAEFGSFSLSELEKVNIQGVRVERVEGFYQAPLSECISQTL